MDNNLLLEISKYLDGDTGVEAIDKGLRSQEVTNRKNSIVHRYLDYKLSTRPKCEELIAKNIIRESPLMFSEIHDILSRISFSKSCEYKISPSIAYRVKKLDFHLRRKVMIKKLGIEDLEKMME